LGTPIKNLMKKVKENKEKCNHEKVTWGLLETSEVETSLNWEKRCKRTFRKGNMKGLGGEASEGKETKKGSRGAKNDYHVKQRIKRRRESTVEKRKTSERKADLKMLR